MLHEGEPFRPRYRKEAREYRGAQTTTTLLERTSEPFLSIPSTLSRLLGTSMRMEFTPMGIRARVVRVLRTLRGFAARPDH